MTGYVYSGGVRFDTDVIDRICGADTWIKALLTVAIGELYDIPHDERPQTQSQFEEWLRARAESLRARQMIEEGV